jgi:hypothetical protein
MAKSTRSTTTSLYTYSAKRSLRAEEIAAYKRIGLATILIVGLLVGGYFLAIPIISHLGSNSSAIPNTTTQLGSTDSIPPAAPKIDALPDAVRIRTLVVSGSAESGSTISIIDNDHVNATTITDKQGLFKQEIQLQPGANTIGATAKDAANNESRGAKTQDVIFDATPPQLSITSPSQDQLTSTTSTITIQGKTEVGAQVTINDRQAIVQGDGTFSQSMSLSGGDNSIIIIATDHAGNISKATRIITYQSPYQSSSSASASANF